MLEIGITFLILLFFIFPIPWLAVCLGAWTCYLIYGKLLLLNRQHSRWKTIVWIHFLTGTTDTVLSIVMAFILALTVYFLIFDGLHLFIFNFIFCFLISFRWFDFTHIIYRRLVLKLQPLSLPPPKKFRLLYVDWTTFRNGHRDRHENGLSRLRLYLLEWAWTGIRRAPIP